VPEDPRARLHVYTSSGNDLSHPNTQTHTRTHRQTGRKTDFDRLYILNCWVEVGAHLPILGH